MRVVKRLAGIVDDACWWIIIKCLDYIDRDRLFYARRISSKRHDDTAFAIEVRRWFPDGQQRGTNFYRYDEIPDWPGEAERKS